MKKQINDVDCMINAFDYIIYTVDCVIKSDDLISIIGFWRFLKGRGGKYCLKEKWIAFVSLNKCTASFVG